VNLKSPKGRNRNPEAKVEELGNQEKEWSSPNMVTTKEKKRTKGKGKSVLSPLKEGKTQRSIRIDGAIVHRGGRKEKN